MTVVFKCGHPAVTVERDVQTAPVCPVCGERIVRNVTGATPRFSGTCRGPLVESAS